MNRARNLTGSALVCIAIAVLGACASSGGGEPPGEARWAANGWLTPDRSGEPVIIGLYVTHKACENALDDWLSSQVVGNPVNGECLPIDRR